MKLEYVLLAALGITGCSAPPTVSQPKQSISAPIEFDKPQPTVDVRPYAELILAPESNIRFVVTDQAEHRSIREVRAYFIPEGKQGIELELTGSELELERKGKLDFWWYAGQFTKIPAGKGKLRIEVCGRQTGVYEVPVTLRKKDYVLTH